MLTTTLLLAALLAIGLFARNYSRRARLLMLCSIIAGILLLIRGQ
ncbi:MAG: hypothetical protein ACLQUY_12495 [Ktedonobacterales bacterium]